MPVRVGPGAPTVVLRIIRNSLIAKSDYRVGEKPDGIDARRGASWHGQIRPDQEHVVIEPKGSKTEENLKAAFAGESQANRRYLYFAQKADIDGHNDVAAVFRPTAEGETGLAHGHLEFLEASGDPATGLPIGDTIANLRASIAGETHEYTDMYPGMAKAEKSHAGKFQKSLDIVLADA